MPLKHVVESGKAIYVISTYSYSYLLPIRLVEDKNPQ